MDITDLIGEATEYDKKQALEEKEPKIRMPAHCWQMILLFVGLEFSVLGGMV